MNRPVTTDVILALDQSTSATKAFLFDAGARILHRVSVEHRQYYPNPGWVEHDAVEILRNTVTALVQVVEESAIDPRRLAALAITNQRETVCAWDSRDGTPAYHAFVWQDERGTDFCRALAQSQNAAEIQRRTGLVLDTYFSASKLQWMVRNVDTARALLSTGHLMAGTVDSWLVWNLTGRRRFVTDVSNASRTLLLNIHTVRWDPELVRIFELEGLQLPEVRNSDEEFGEWHSEQLGLTLPIIGVMGDSHASLFGQAGFRAGNAKTTYGTGSSVMMNIGTRAIEPPRGIVTSVGWGCGGDVTYVFEGNIHSTGDTMRWVRDNLGLFSDFDEAEERAASIPENEGVYLIPAFNGLGAPHWKHGVRAVIAGLSRGSGAAHIIRAALESIAYQVHDVVEQMASESPAPPEDLRVDGGGSANRLLAQFQADILDAPIYIASIDAVSARGVAFVAGLRTSVWPAFEQLSRLAEPAGIYRPRMDSDDRLRYLAGWRHAVAQALLTES